MSLAIAFVLLAPPAEGPHVGVVWADDAVDRTLRGRIVAKVERDLGAGAVVIDAADRAARAAIAFEVSRTQVEGQRARLARLEAGETAYRGGDPQGALAAANDVIAEARADPTAPGLVALLIRAHLLRAQVARTEGDATASDDALRTALRLDPDARVSTRRLPPDLVARHESLRAEILVDRASWQTIEIATDADASIEIDGRVGIRDVPPGEHLVVVRRPGAAPVGAWVEQSWVAPDPGRRLATGLPGDAADAERICGALDLRRIVLVRQRQARVGLQEYRCGGGFTTTAFADTASPEVGLTALRDAPLAADEVAAATALRDDRRWPVPEVFVRRDPENDQPPAPRPWWRRGWVWGVIATVVVGGVVTGAVVGTRDDPSGYVVDGDSFIDR